MGSDSIPLWIIFIICVVGGAYFAATESSFSAVNKIKIKALADDGNKKAQGVMFILNKFDKALTNLQKNLFITMYGRTQKLSRKGEPYGWNSTVFTTVEDFWGEDLTPNISVDEAYEKIRERILFLNPEAKEKDIKKFI